MALPLRVQVFGQAPPDLIEDEADERLGPDDIRWRHDQIKRRRLIAADQLADAPVTAPRHLGDNGIAVEAQERHGGRENAGALIVRLVEEFARGTGNHGMGAGLA